MQQRPLGAPRRKPSLDTCGLLRRFVPAVTLLALPLSAAAQPTFPSTGYQPILVDPEDPTVPDNVDIVSIGYQQDGIFAYFEIVVAGTAGFSSDRYYLYLDLDGDGQADRLLRNTSAANASLDQWNVDHWESFGSAWSEDPNGTPDDRVYFACNLSDLNGGDFVLVAAVEDQPGFDDDIRDPNDDPDADEVSDNPSSNPTPVIVADFSVARAHKRLRTCWRAAGDPDIAGFNLYALREPTLAGVGAGKQRTKLNKRLIPARSPFAEPHYVFVCPVRHAKAQGYQLEVIGLDGATKTVALARLPHVK